MKLTIDQFLSSEALKFENCKDLNILIQTEFNRLKTLELSSLEVLDLLLMFANEVLDKVILMALQLNAKHMGADNPFKKLNEERVRFLLQTVRAIKNSIHDEEN